MKTIKAKGSFYDIGRIIGRTTATNIYFQSVHLVSEILKDGFDGDELAMMRACRLQHSMTEKYWPDAHQFLQGMARGAGITLEDLLPITYCEEIAIGPSAESMKEKCSTIVLRTKEGWVIGHQEDYIPTFYGKLVVYDLEFDGHPRMVSLNYPGTFPGTAGSLNAKGIATTNNSLWPKSAGGIAKQVKHFHASLETSLIGAISHLLIIPHVLTDHFTLIDAETDLALSLEVTSHPSAPNDCELRFFEHEHDHQEDESIPTPFWHANHVRWLEPWASGAEKDPANKSSAMRAEKMQEICALHPPTSAMELEALLTQKDGIINRDADYDLTESSTVTLATTIIIPAQKEIRFTRYGMNDDTPLIIRLD